MIPTKYYIAITRDGGGELWLFDTFEEADRHPLIQVTDPVIAGSEGIVKKLPVAGLPRLMRRIGDEEVAKKLDEALARAESYTEAVVFTKEYSLDMWRAMMNVARRPPDAPQEICDRVRRDRELGIEEARAMDNATPTNVKSEQTGKAEKKAPRSGLDKTKKIELQKDGEGNKFGKENNPKRAGSASAERFALYKDGMTVEEALNAGVTSTDINHDVGKGFIKLV